MTIELGNANNGIPRGAYISSGADATAYHFKGSVNTYADLATIVNPSQGDVYDVKENGKNYAWTGTEWDDLGGTVDLSGYYTKTEVDALLENVTVDLSDYYDKMEVDALFEEIDGGDAEKPEAKPLTPSIVYTVGTDIAQKIIPAKADAYTVQDIGE
jgi:hypothetical protein